MIKCIEKKLFTKKHAYENRSSIFHLEARTRWTAPWSSWWELCKFLMHPLPPSHWVTGWYLRVFNKHSSLCKRGLFHPWISSGGRANPTQSPSLASVLPRAMQCMSLCNSSNGREFRHPLESPSIAFHSSLRHWERASCEPGPALYPRVIQVTIHE